MKIEIEYPLTVNGMYEILTDAFESGSIDYWAITIDYAKDSDHNILEWKILESDERDGKEHKYVIGAHAIEKGIKRIFKSDFKVDEQIKMDILNNEMDSTAYDCIIQAALFGELVYG